MRVLVTGCAGRVGEAATAHLIAKGHDVRGLDVVETFGGTADYRSCDLLDVGAIVPHLDDIDAVLHLAAVPALGRAANADIFQVNTAGKFNVFDGCYQKGIKRVVVASSINAIGYFFGSEPFEIDYLPVDEVHRKLTSDAYSFSKQVTEEIGAYFWRREGISNTCLRFGAGLRPLDEMRETQADRFAWARDYAEELLTQDEQAKTETMHRLREAYDQERRDRTYEREAGRSPDLTPVEHVLMTLRHNYFSFVSLEDACVAMELALAQAYEGSHTLLIVDRNNTLMMSADNLAKLVYPDVEIRKPLEGTQSLVDWQRASELMGFESRHSAGMVLQ